MRPEWFAVSWKNSETAGLSRDAKTVLHPATGSRNSGIVRLLGKPESCKFLLSNWLRWPCADYIHVIGGCRYIQRAFFSRNDCLVQAGHRRDLLSTLSSRERAASCGRLNLSGEALAGQRQLVFGGDSDEKTAGLGGRDRGGDRRVDCPGHFSYSGSHG